MKRILFYTNQFFGQIGGEDKAYEKPFVKECPVGPAMGFAAALEDTEIVATIICGDNYYVENMDEVRAFIREQLQKYDVDFFIAGPAFNAGRFGVACADACAYVKKDAGIEAITGLNEENPAVEMYRKEIYILKTGKSAAAMKKAIEAMSAFTRKILAGDPPGLPSKDGYFPIGKRVNVFKEKKGAERALDMLVAKLRNEPFTTELELSTYEKVAPAPPVNDLSQAKVALLTSGGIVPFGNPDHLPAASAKFWKEYSIDGIDALKTGEFESVHAGYDPVYANNDPNRVAPLDVLRHMEKEGKIESLYPNLIATTGNSTSVADATRMGQEIAFRLRSAGVQAALLTSTWGTCTRCGATIVKQLEKAGIPTVHVCTVTPISKTVGAARIYGAHAIPYPTGNPSLLPEKELERRREIVENALELVKK